MTLRGHEVVLHHILRIQGWSKILLSPANLEEFATAKTQMMESMKIIEQTIIEPIAAQTEQDAP